MKFLRYLLPIVIVACGFTLSTSLFANDSLTKRDFQIVEDYLTSKRTMDLREKSCNLTISGDVRTDWRHFTEKQDGRSLLGGNAVSATDGLPLSRNQFDIDFDLYIDYVCDRAWGVAWIEFDNTAGVERNFDQCVRDVEACGGSGLCNELCLKKAYIGYNICCAGSNRLDIEIGRRPLWTVFDSRIQFQERFDGVLLRFSTTAECFGDFYITGGVFLKDERVSDFGAVVEIGFLNIMDYGFDFKYSFINWPKLGGGKNRCFVQDPLGWRFRNSQWLVAYNFNPDLICTPAQIYGAILWNHDARRLQFDDGDFDDRRRGLAWYVGFTIGEVYLEGDWAIDVDYEYVEKRAVSDCDLSGIGRGNFDPFFLDPISRGQSNYKGWRFEGLYALTDNLILDTIIEFSRAAQTVIGGHHTFSKYELQAIYAF